MKNIVFKTASMAVMATLLPNILQAQGLAGEVHSLQSVLDQLYVEMIPLCSQLINVARGLAGFAALWYIASRVWRHLANAESIDFYPLLRPFALGLAILLFPSVLTVINGVLSPIVTGTAAMVENSNNSIAFLLQKREQEIKQTPEWQMYAGDDDYDRWYKYTNPTSDGNTSWLEGITNQLKFAFAKTKYAIENVIKRWMASILHLFYEAAALCINTIRTFYLVVLSILGPIVFGIAVFDGMQNTLAIWFARYINVFLWLPIANIFGAMTAKIQENMLRIDMQQIEQYGETFFTSSDTAYLIFMIIAIVGYFTVPNISNFIVSVAGENVHLTKSTNFFKGEANAATSMATAPARHVIDGLTHSRSLGATGNDSANNHYMHDKLSGK